MKIDKCFGCEDKGLTKCCKVVDEQEKIIATLSKRNAVLEDAGWELYFQTEMLSPNSGSLEKWAKVNGVEMKAV